MKLEEALPLPCRANKKTGGVFFIICSETFKVHFSFLLYLKTILFREETTFFIFSLFLKHLSKSTPVSGVLLPVLREIWEDSTRIATKITETDTHLWQTVS